MLHAALKPQKKTRPQPLFMENPQALSRKTQKLNAAAPPPCRNPELRPKKESKKERKKERIQGTTKKPPTKPLVNAQDGTHRDSETALLCIGVWRSRAEATNQHSGRIPEPIETQGKRCVVWYCDLMFNGQRRLISTPWEPRTCKSKTTTTNLVKR